MAANKPRASGPPAKSNTSDSKPVVVINPAFKWAVIINIVICTTTLCTMILVVILASKENRLAEQLYSTCEKVFTLTTGAFIGLLGGKASSPDKQMTVP